MLCLLTCVRNVGGPHDPADLLHALEVGAEAAVAAEDLLVHDGGDGQTVETVREGLPQLNVVSPLTYEHNHYLRLPMAVCLVKFNC